MHNLTARTAINYRVERCRTKEVTDGNNCSTRCPLCNCNEIAYNKFCRLGTLEFCWIFISQVTNMSNSALTTAYWIHRTIHFNSVLPPNYNHNVCTKKYSKKQCSYVEKVRVSHLRSPVSPVSFPSSFFGICGYVILGSSVNVQKESKRNSCRPWSSWASVSPRSQAHAWPE